jgi:hypothetical protein
MKASKSNLAAALTGKLRANRMRRLVTQESESLSGHYTRLPEVNEKIVKMDETTIDERLPLVEQGVESCRICQERIAAVTKGLNDLLGAPEQAG